MRQFIAGGRFAVTGQGPSANCPIMRPAPRLLGLATVLLALCALPARADTDDGQAWLNLTVQGPVKGKLLAWAEVQGRFGDDVSRLSTSILRPGVGYQLSRDVSVWVGYARVTTHNPGADIGEDRIWQQVSWNAGQVLGGSFSTRTRLEQRLLENGTDTGWRLRQFVKYSRPFRKGGDTALVATSELFVALNDADWGARAGFDQIRNFAGVAFSVSPKARMEFGYLNQYINRPGPDDRVNHAAAVNLLARF